MRDIGLRKNERRAKLDHVVMRPIRSCEDSQIAEAVYDVRGLLWRRLARFPGAYQIQPQKQSRASDIANKSMRLLKLLECTTPIFSDSERILLQFFLLQDIQHSET